MEGMTDSERLTAINFAQAYNESKGPELTQNLTDWESQMRDSRGKGGISMEKLNPSEMKEATQYKLAYDDIHNINPLPSPPP